MTATQFNVQNLLTGLLADLSERSRDVIVSRFGIGKDRYETLEAIGKRYGITRERVRQIEADALKNIKKAKNSPLLQPLLTNLEKFIQAKGGVMDEDSLTSEFSSRHFTGTEDPSRSRGVVSLLLAVGDRFKKSSANDTFSTRWFVDEASVKRQEELTKHLAGLLAGSKRVLSENEVVSMAQNFNKGLSRDTVLNYLTGSRIVGQNIFGQWGLSHWAEIKPRGVKDKAYLVMKQENKPLHFREVAEFINRNNFSNRKALAQTVHNELIKDSRFVLVGRGLYALKEWGYTEGTVKDVISKVLKKEGPLEKEDLVKAVLAERFVKPSTIVLNLNSFNKDSEGKYKLA